MICPDCEGIGEMLIDANGRRCSLKDAALLVPCADCGGSGIAHCCEGDSATNENASKEQQPAQPAK